MSFKKYKFKYHPEMRKVSAVDISNYTHFGKVVATKEFSVHIDDVDKAHGSPKIGDMIARNSTNHSTQWLIPKDYFEETFEPIITLNPIFPKDIKEKLRTILEQYGYSEASVDEISEIFNLQHRDLVKQMELFGQHVVDMPKNRLETTSMEIHCSVFRDNYLS